MINTDKNQRSLTSRMRWLFPKVGITVAPDLFTFTSGESTLSLQTCLYLKIKNDQEKVISVGHKRSGEPGAYLIELFANSPAPLLKMDKQDCLTAFIEYGLRNVLPGPQFVRPIILFQEIHNLDTVLSGYQARLLKVTGEAAGARSILFA